MSKKIGVPWWWLNVEKIALMLALGGVLGMYAGVIVLGQQQRLVAQLWLPFTTPPVPQFEFNWQALNQAQLTQRLLNHFAKHAQDQNNQNTGHQSIQFTQTHTRLDLSLHVSASQLQSLYALPATPGWVLTDVQAKLTQLSPKMSVKPVKQNKTGIMDTQYITLHLGWQATTKQVSATLYPPIRTDFHTGITLAKAFFDDVSGLDSSILKNKIASTYLSNGKSKKGLLNMDDSQVPAVHYLGYLHEKLTQKTGVWLALTNNHLSALPESEKSINNLLFLQLGHYYKGWQLIAVDAQKAVIKQGNRIQWLPLCKTQPCAVVLPPLAERTTAYE